MADHIAASFRLYLFTVGDICYLYIFYVALNFMKQSLSLFTFVCLYRISAGVLCTVTLNGTRTRIRVLCTYVEKRERFGDQHQVRTYVT